MHRVLLTTGTVLALLGGSLGQQPCRAEVKLLLDPAGVQGTAKALSASTPAFGRVVLYDTDSRDLLAHGIVLRVRQGATTDLTVKLRLPSETKVPGNFGKLARLKCEVDYAGGMIAHSYSIQTKLTTEAPKTGAALSKQLTASQQRLLSQSGYAIDWSKLTLVANILSTGWSIPKQPPFGKLAMELWVWPGGSVLELSARADAAALQATYEQLHVLAARKDLVLNNTQQFKTELVLKR